MLTFIKFRDKNYIETLNLLSKIYNKLWKFSAVSKIIGVSSQMFFHYQNDIEKFVSIKTIQILYCRKEI